MLLAECIISNLEGGRFEWYAKVTDERHTFTMTQRTTPKRDVDCGHHRPTQSSYASPRTARESIARHAPRLNWRIIRVEMVAYAWQDGRRTFVDRKEIP